MSGATLPGAGRETADAGAGVGTERTAPACVAAGE
jgi:hypothetical protein